MKIHYKISQLLKACVCSAFGVCTLASGNLFAIEETTELTETDTEITALTSLQTITEEMALLADDIIITDGDEALLVDGGSLDEMAGDISVTNVTGNTTGIETINGGHVDLISGDIEINHDGSAGSYAYGVLIDGNKTAGTTSSVGTITGEITVNGNDAYSYGVLLYGETASYNTTGGNTLDAIADTAIITVNTTTYTAWGVRNAYGTIGTVAGEISAISVTGAAYAVGNYGTIGTVSADIYAERTGTGTNAVSALYNFALGKTGTITSVTSTITAININGECDGIKNIGNIGTISADVTATTTGTGSAYTILNFGADISTGITAIDGGTYIANANSGYAVAVWNQMLIGSITDADFEAYSTSGYSYGFYNKNYYSNKTATINSISGTITTIGGTASYGIYNTSVIGTVSATIDTSSSGSAYGVYNSAAGTLGAISSDITVQSGTGSSMGIISYNTTDAVSFSGTITATSDSGTSMGIAAQSGSINFGDGASVSASSTSGAAYALYSDADQLTLSADSGTVTLSGDLIVADGTGSLVFESGNYMISSTAWEVAEVVFSQGTTVTLTVASAEPEVATYSLVLKGDSASSDTTMVIQEGTTLTFEVSSVDALNGLDSALFIVDSSVDLSGIEAVSIILMDDGEAWSDGDTIDVSKLIAYSGSDSTEEDLAIAIFDDVTISVTDADLQTTTVLAASTDSEGDSGLVFTNPDIVPEPSTVTLSLLALAGLCARRRRKA